MLNKVESSEKKDNNKQWFQERDSLRSKRFRLVSERRKTGFCHARNEARAKKLKRGGRGREGRKLPAILLAPFFAQSLTLVPRSLLLNPRKRLLRRLRETVEITCGNLLF